MQCTFSYKPHVQFDQCFGDEATTKPERLNLINVPICLSKTYGRVANPHENKYLSYQIQLLHSLSPLFSIIESSTSAHVVDDKNAEPDAAIVKV